VPDFTPRARPRAFLISFTADAMVTPSLSIDLAGYVLGECPLVGKAHIARCEYQRGNVSAHVIGHFRCPLERLGLSLALICCPVCDLPFREGGGIDRGNTCDPGCLRTLRVELRGAPLGPGDRENLADRVR